MLKCIIYNETNDKEEMVLTIKHFREQLVDSVFTLSCVFPIESEIWKDDLLDSFTGLSLQNIGNIKVFDEDNNLIASYSRYNAVQSIAIDYNPFSKDGVILFTRGNLNSDMRGEV